MERLLIGLLAIVLHVFTCSLSALPCAEASTAKSSHFCGRAEASRTCPTPPTFDSIRISSYIGSWYQIGAGAMFTFMSEPGLVCGRARYTLADNSSTIRVLNSGLTVLSPAGVADVSRVGTALSSVCSGARAVCYSSPPAQQAVSQIEQVAHKLATSHPYQAASLWKTAGRISRYIAFARSAVGEAASDVSAVQILLNQVSQAHTNVQATVDLIKGRTKRVRKEGLSEIASAVDHLQQAQARLLAVKSSAKEDNETARALQESADGVGSAARHIRSSVEQMKKALSEADRSATSLLQSGKPAAEGRLFKIEGTAVQVNASLSAGKLEVTFFGQGSPYWVLAVEGDYKAALVYSCTAGQSPGQLDKSLFILSRTPVLSSRVVARFLSLAHSYGVYSDCDDPFLFTVQRGGTCGLP